MNPNKTPIIKWVQKEGPYQNFQIGSFGTQSIGGLIYIPISILALEATHGEHWIPKAVNNIGLGLDLPDPNPTWWIRATQWPNGPDPS